MTLKAAEAWRRLRSHKWLSLSLDVVLIVGVLLAVHAWQTRNLPVNEPAPETVLALLDGSGVASARKEGVAGVIYFFAPWCFYCKSSISNLDDLVADGRIGWGRAVALDYESAKAVQELSLIHISEPTRQPATSRMPSSA